MNKFLGLTLAILFVANPVFAQDANPIQWGVSLGTGTTEYESISLQTRGSRTDRVDFSSLLLGIDARSGKHQVSFATNTADEESMSISGSYYDDYSNPSRTSDFSDQSFTYTYSLTDKWRVSLGYNTLTIDKGWGNTYDRTTSFIVGATDTYTITDAFSTSTERSGATALISYVQPFGESGKWIAVGRIGFTAQEFDESGAGTLRYSGVSAASEACWNGTTCPRLSYKTNGDGYDYDKSLTGDSTSAIFGISVIYVLDNPRHTLNFDFTTRDNDYGVLTGTSKFTAIGGYFTGDSGRSSTSDLDTGGVEVDETIWTFTVKWRYGLN